MSMRKTLALIYLALVWSRQALTLTDLLRSLSHTHTRTFSQQLYSSFEAAVCPGPALSRLVTEGFVPYLTAYEGLPMEMTIRGRHVPLFRVEVRSPSRCWYLFCSESCNLMIFSFLQTLPSYSAVHQDTETLLQLLQLPAFPPISEGIPLHPALLSLRYLRDANLPGNRPSNNKVVSFTDL